MNIKLSDFKAGVMRQGDNYKYFLPNPIHVNFIIDDQTIISLLEKASQSLGELNALANFVPNIELYIHSIVAKEAVKSNSIEGTRTNIAEALSDKSTIDPERKDDWLEVQQYIQAMSDSIKSLEKLPISSRLIKSAHKTLLSGVRGTHKQPGEFRKSQNWIGGITLQDASFVPPSHAHIHDLMSDLENFLNDRNLVVPDLIRIGIAHYQFETIHPFLDGNGRTGRLLITLYLVSSGALSKPLLYLSEFFDKHRQLYYDNLRIVSSNDNLIQWIKYFLVGIIETSKQSTKLITEIHALKEDVTINRIPKINTRYINANELMDHLFIHPILNSNEVGAILDITVSASNKLIRDFEELNILTEITGKKRGKIYAFNEYLELLGL